MTSGLKTDGISTTTADAMLLGSVALCAVTISVWGEDTTAGAVYTPCADTLPRSDGFTLQYTPSVDPETEKFCSCDAASLTCAGSKVIGVRVTTDVANLVESTRLVAVTVTFCGTVISEGAMYKPVMVEMLPNAGVTDQ